MKKKKNEQNWKEKKNKQIHKYIWKLQYCSVDPSQWSTERIDTESVKQ